MGAGERGSGSGLRELENLDDRKVRWEGKPAGTRVAGQGGAHLRETAAGVALGWGFGTTGSTSTAAGPLIHCPAEFISFRHASPGSQPAALMDLARRANPPMLASVIEATGSSGFRRGRPTEHLRVIYGLSRADCIAGRFSPSAEAPASGRPFGQLARGTGSRCTDGVGLGIHGSYSGAAAHSIGNISAMLPYLESSHSLTLELWLRAPPQPESENAVPIVALGSERSADFDACARGDIGLRLSQNGGYLELELSSAVPIRGRHTCYHVEVSGCCLS